MFDDYSAVAERLSLIVCFANCRQPEYGMHVLVTSVLLKFKNVFAGHRNSYAIAIIHLFYFIVFNRIILNSDESSEAS